MAHSYNFSSDSMVGGFQLIRICFEGSDEVILFGTFKDSYEGRIYIPMNAVLTTEIISEIHEELKKRFPPTYWTVVHDRHAASYAEMKKLFEPTGIQENNRMHV